MTRSRGAIFVRYGTSFDRTGAAILGVILAGLSLLVLAAEAFARQRYQRRLAARKLAPPRPIPLGRWRWVAMAFLAFVVLVSLVLPVGVLVYWLIRGWRAGTDFPPIWEATRHSVTIAAGGALVTVSSRCRSPFSRRASAAFAARGIEQAAFLTHALPGLVVALSLVFFGIRYARDLYQTIWMLLFAYVILFLPNALAAMRSPLMRQSPRLEEAGASLGRSPLRVLLTVTLPIARPGALAAFALVFLTILKELPATLLLSPTGYSTLPGVIWAQSSDALYGSARAARARAPRGRCDPDHAADVARRRGRGCELAMGSRTIRNEPLNELCYKAP